LIGASAVFGELRDSLNLIWNHETQTLGLMGFLRYRLFTFAVVMAVGFLLLVSLVVSTMLAFLGNFVNSHMAVPPVVALVLEPVISIVVTTLLFALIYKYIPDVPVKWRDVQIGALFTAVLFSIGKSLIGLYLGKASVGSAYGAAGSLVVLLVWVYYSSQVFFFGAEFTKVYSERNDVPHTPGIGIAL
jgi:membrane protein